MQVHESEIIIPLKRRFDPMTIIIVVCVAFVIIVGEFIYESILPLLHHNVGILDILPDSGAFVCMLVFLGVLFAVNIRQLHAPSPYIRVSHEGIFTSHGEFLIKWEEIKELSPLRERGANHVRIILRNQREVYSRANILSKSFLLVGFDERTLPISVDELLATIQMHFATDLRLHAVTVSEWQH